MNTINDFDFNSPLISSFKAGNRFTKTKEVVCYHYTSAHVLTDILKTPSLRFTDIRFMNDYSENVFFIKCLLEFLLKNKTQYPFCLEVVNALLLKKHTANEYLNLSVPKIEYEESLVYHYNPSNCFVFCMSEAPDSLQMWNYYLHDGKYEGYNIGFDVYKFLKSFDTQNEKSSDPVVIHYGKILYKSKQHEKAIKELVDSIEKNANQKEYNPNLLDYYMVHLRLYIESYGPFFKHEAFSNEKEYRIVILINDVYKNSKKTWFFNKNIKAIKLDYFDRNGVLVPYLSVPIDKKAIKTITLSPAIEKVIAATSLEEFLKTNGYHAQISHSSIPIRF